MTSITTGRLRLGAPAAIGLLVLVAAPVLHYCASLVDHATSKDLSVWLVALVTMAFAARYTWQVWRREISPTFSTWIIFLLGTGFSLATYAIAEHRDFASGILNTMDVVAVAVILVATVVWGQRTVRFKPFEKWYLELRSTTVLVPVGVRALGSDH